MKTNSEIAAALRAAKWVDEPIGNKALVLAACQALEKAGQPARVIAYRVLTADGKPWTDWISGCPAEDEKPLLPEGAELAEGSFELAYSAPVFQVASGPWRLVPVDATPAMVDAAKKVEEDGYDAMHKAMLAAAPERERLTVWEGTMPESNGKTNYTAILHKGDITEGMTIARSEYPDRVRYEADLVRWLIGERAERPWITDYDDQKHSGYVPPAKPEQEPLGYISKKDLARLQDDIAWDGTHLSIGVDHRVQWREDTPYDNLVPIYADPDNIPGALEKCMQAMADRDAHAKKVEKLQAALRLMTDTSSYLLDGLINATEDFEEGNGISGEEIEETRAAIASAKELL